MKILVVQLLNKQRAQILSRYKGPHELHIIQTRSNEPRMTELAASVGWADKIIVMTRFVAHKQTDLIPREKSVFCNGGMSTLLHIIEELKDE